MTDHKRLTVEEIAEMRKRAQEDAECNPLRDSGAMVKMYDSIDDVPKLIAENERLQSRIKVAEDLLSEAYDLLDDIHGYDTDVYHAITEYFDGGDDE